MKEEIRQRFCNLLGEDRVLVQEPMSRHTTFRIGGAADLFLMPGSLREVQEILGICREEAVPWFILGN